MVNTADSQRLRAVHGRQAWGKHRQTTTVARIGDYWTSLITVLLRTQWIILTGSGCFVALATEANVSFTLALDVAY